MKLSLFTEAVCQKQSAKEIYLVGATVSCWQELCDKYDVLPRIAGAFDSSPRNQGEKIFRGKKISVLPLAKINHLSSEALLIITDDYFAEVYEALKSYGEDLGDIYYFVNQDTAYYLAYKEKFKDSPLKNILLFRSGPHASAYIPGMDFADNARALFEYMLQQGWTDKYQFVWLVKNPQEYSARYQQYDQVNFLPWDGAVSEDIEVRESYYEALCLAKYIFFTDAYGFARHARKDQIRVQLWHGCGIKGRAFFSLCENRYEYTTVIGDMYARLHAKDYGLRAEQVLVTGYPKDDWLFHPCKNWQDKFHIPQAAKYIFWLPTFRAAAVEGLAKLTVQEGTGETGLPIVRSAAMLRELNSTLQAKNVVLLIKLHPFQKREAVSAEAMSNIRFLENEDLRRHDVQINELLGHADALISDYSSAAVDYTLLDRPIAFTLDDCEDYKNSRGFNWPNVLDYLPGEEIYDFADFLAFVSAVTEDRDLCREKRRKLRSLFHKYTDDQSAARVVKILGL